MDAIERWLRDNNHTTADSRIPLATLLSVPSIQRLQLQHSFPSHSILAFLQQHPTRIQVGDAHTKNPWVYSIAPVQQRHSLAPLDSKLEQRNYLSTTLMPEDDLPNPAKSASIILFTPSGTPGVMSILMAQSKNGKFGFTGAKSLTHEKSLFETAQRGFDESTGGVLQVLDDRDEHHLAPEVAEAARAHGKVLWNKNVALFFAPLACLPGIKANPEFLPQQHQRMLQNPAVHQDFKRKLSLAWCELSWNEASQSIGTAIPGRHAGLADWTAQDLESESFKEWFKLNAGLVKSVARAQPSASRTSTSTSWIRDYLAGAKSIFRSIPSYCSRKPKEERLQACSDRLQRLSGILTAVLSGSNTVGLEDLDDRDKLLGTVTETCVLLQVIADELDRSDERKAFVCRCNEVADLCEREKMIKRGHEGVSAGARSKATEPAIEVGTPQKFQAAPVAPISLASGLQKQQNSTTKACSFDNLDELLKSGRSGKIKFQATSASEVANAEIGGSRPHCKLRGCLMPACIGKGGFCMMHGG